MFGNDYRGKKVIVTGAASGMGKATAELLLQLEADVIGLDIQPIENPEMEAKHINLLEEQSIRGVVDELGDGSIYGAFLCAGLPQTFSDVDVVTVNFGGNRLLMELLVPKMTAGSSAMAVITSMTLGWVPHAEMLAPLINTHSMAEAREWAESSAGVIADLGDSYIVAKEAMAAWATMQSTRWIQQGIRVNCLCPGLTSTPMMAHFEEAAGEALALLPQPLGRNTNTEEQAFAMVFLNHPRSSAVVGLSLYNDGGSAAALMTAAAAGLM